MRRDILVFLILGCFPAAPAAADLAADLARQDAAVFTPEQRESAADMIERDLQRREDAANARNRAEWLQIQDRAQWEDYSRARLARLKASLGSWPEPPAELRVHLSSQVEGDGFVIENLAYESRPGAWVPGNLYRPSRPAASMPGILIAHAHHRGKEQSELQDMGMTWARAGCLVLVIDQVGYGERRAHPFAAPADYPRGDFSVGRQDYYHRYDSGLQLHLAGESLMGWMVWDQMRGVDLLLAREGIDPKRIIMLGAVAGGGDPCGITAALDDRIAAAVPFNFGGPQPESPYPLPVDAESSFNYLMGSYWDSTRGLRRTAADGFFHWVITASIAPRRLIHAHEFAWDRERDPVWKRYRRIYDEFYGVPDHLAAAHGKGLLRQSSQEASHCGQIGRFHRRMIHPVFRRWFGIEAGEDDEFSAPRQPHELRCLPPETRSRLQPAGFVKLVSDQGARRVRDARATLAALGPPAQRKHLREQWSVLLGKVTPHAPARVRSSRFDESDEGDLRIQRVLLEPEPEILIPLLMLWPPAARPEAPVVLAIAQAGKKGFLEHRSGEIAALLSRGAVVCLPDLRGTGESRAGSSRDRTSGDTNRSVNMQLHGETILGQRLRDLRSVLAWLRQQPELEARAICLWGDSFAPRNDPGTDFQVPHGVGARPPQPEPLGGLLALLAGLYEEGLHRVFIRHGLHSWQSGLDGPHVYLPHDTIVPGALTTGDLSDLAASLAPLPLRLDQFTDALGRPLDSATARKEYQRALDSYRAANAAEAFQIDGETPAIDWLLTDRPR